MPEDIKSLLASKLGDTKATEGPEEQPEFTKESEDMEQKMHMNILVSRIHSNLAEAETSRLPVESQWIKNIQAYRAVDTSGDEFRSTEEHKPYIRTTTVKTRAAYAQIMETLMQNSRFPLMIEPTPVPEGVPALVTDAQPMGGPETQEDFGIGFEGDGKELAPGATADGMLWKQDDPIYQNMNGGKDRSGGQFAQLSPAARSAEKMTKVIQDQLEESNAHTELRKSVFESCLLGSGIMKGVFTEEKTLHKWTDGEYTPEKRKFPKVQSTSIWDLYIDPNAVVMEDAEWVIERHRMTRKQMYDLKQRTGFRPGDVDVAITTGANYTRRSYESVVKEEESTVDVSRLWEVLEYWGYVTGEEARAAGMPVDDSINDTDQLQVNVWICGNTLLRIMVNPFLPQRIPYFLFCYEVDPYNIYGTGVPETMEDSQKMMNGFARLAVDNLALAGNLVFDVDESMLVPGQDMTIYPGKVFRRQGGQAGQAIHGVKFPSTANENMLMFREFRQIADESTGIPSVSHGQTGVTGVGRTSSGLNMILENASLNIKTVVRNVDDDLLQPLGRALFYWNNQFNSENIPKGDFDVLATGIRSYTKQEIKVQRLQTLLGLVQNPALAPMVRLPYIVRELVKGMDMDPDEVINDLEEAKVYAQIIGMAGGVSAQSRQAAGAQAEGPVGTSGATGNFESSGNPGGANGQASAPTS